MSFGWGDAATDADLRTRIPYEIADASRAYGVRTSGTISVRQIDGSDYTAPVNAETIYGYGNLGVAGVTGVTQSALDQELSELVGTAPANRDTLGELSSAIDAKVTNADLGTAATESTAVAASRRAVGCGNRRHSFGRGRLRHGGRRRSIVDADAACHPAPWSPDARAQLLNLGEDIDANAMYQFVGNEGNASRATAPSAVILGAHLLDNDICPVQLTTPTTPANALDLKLSRGNNSGFDQFGHESLYIYRRTASTLWMVFSSSDEAQSFRVYKLAATAAVPQITDDDLDVGTPANESTTAGASRQAIAEQFALESSQQVSQVDGISRTLILWGRFASEPGPTDYPAVVWTGLAYSGSLGSWHRTQAEATGTNTLYMLIATSTYNQGTWTQSAWSHVPIDLPTQYSEDASSWHGAQTDDDEYLRYRTTDGDWSPAIYIGDQPPEVWTNIGSFHLNNTETANFAITPIDLSQHSRLRVVCREFATWSDYSSSHWASVREAEIPTEDMQTVSETAAASVILNEPQNPIGCRFMDTGSFIGLGQVDVSGSAVRGPFNFSFAFAGPSGGLAERIRVIQRGPSWSWAKIDIYLR